jgi:Cu+-exporting ATPase
VFSAKAKLVQAPRNGPFLFEWRACFASKTRFRHARLILTFFRRHCPENVTVALAPMVAQGQVKILKPLAFPTTDVLEIEYTPSVPDFTIRSIIDLVATSKPSGTSMFDVKIYKPPTLEERAKAMYQHEQRALLYRLLFAVVVAIPTFIIGIVYMSLVPHDDATRMWLMSPMWAGRASKTEWALFFLATPVMFYSCGLFHRRYASIVLLQLAELMLNP